MPGGSTRHWAIRWRPGLMDASCGSSPTTSWSMTSPRRAQDPLTETEAPHLVWDNLPARSARPRALMSSISCRPDTASYSRPSPRASWSKPAWMSARSRSGANRSCSLSSRDESDIVTTIVPRAALVTNRGSSTKDPFVTLRTRGSLLYIAARAHTSPLGWAQIGAHEFSDAANRSGNSTFRGLPSLPWAQGVAGLNPVAPTTSSKKSPQLKF